MRDYTNFDIYLDKLNKDIYSQPEDDGHTHWASKAVEWLKQLLSFYNVSVNTVVDVGCGTGFCSDFLPGKYHGLTASSVDMKATKGRSVIQGDMTFLPWTSRMDLIFARHILEHSPFPIITLMEWRRVANHLFLVAPAPEYWGYYGKNHYSVANKDQIWWWLRRSGWGIIDQKDFTTDSIDFVIEYAGNRDRTGKEPILYPGPPRIVEYWYFCKRDIQVTE